MKHLYENTPFNQFEERWLEELDKEFLTWLDHVAFFISQKNLPTDRFCGFGAPSEQNFKMFATIYHMVATNRFETKIEVATYVTSNIPTKNPIATNAWLGFLHFLLTSHKEAKNLKNIIEAIYCMSAVACNRG